MMIEQHHFFWRQHPALLFSLTLLVGVGAALFWLWPWNWIFPLLWSSYLLSMKKWPVLVVLAASIVYCFLLYAHEPKSGPASGVFSIRSLKSHQSPFGKGFVYQGKLYTKDGTVPCDVYTQGKAPPYSADCDYFLKGKLIKRGKYQYLFKPSEWSPIENTWSLANARYLAKEKYRTFLTEKCRGHERAALFLASLTTGDVDDRMLKYEFGRLGLQHLLSISGFHFGILIAFASFGLSFFFPPFWKWIALLISLSLYFFFVGPCPAVLRSWLTAIAYLVGKLLRRKTSGLNLLGFTLGSEITLDPLVASNLGFQFSFAATGAILLLYPILEEKLLQKQERTSIFPLYAKSAYLLSQFLRRAILLTLSVNAAMLPIVLFHFHAFPLLSLLYNLFFPFAVGIALSSLLFALALHLFIPVLGSFFFSMTGHFTAILLDLAAYPPSALDYPLMIPCFPKEAIPFCLFFIIIFSIKKIKYLYD